MSNDIKLTKRRREIDFRARIKGKNKFKYRSVHMYRTEKSIARITGNNAAVPMCYESLRDGVIEPECLASRDSLQRDNTGIWR